MKFLKNNTGKILFLVIVLTLVFLFLKNCRGGNSEGTGKAPDSVFYWKNKADDAVASMRAVLRDWSISEQSLLDSIAKIYNTKPRRIIEYITITQEADTEVQPDGPVEKDYYPPVKDCPPQVKNMSQRFRNAYYDASVRIGADSYMRLTALDTITVVWKNVREGSIFNRKHFLQLDVSNANPHVKTTGLQAYRIPEKKPKKWSIGLQAGYGVSTDLKPEPYIGIGLSRSIIRF